MDINTERYYNCVDWESGNSGGFLLSIYRKNVSLFNEIFKLDWRVYQTASSCVYEDLHNQGYDTHQIIKSNEYIQMEDKYNPFKKHKFIWSLAKLPLMIHGRICVGHNHHILDHLLSPQEMTIMDKIRYYLITGYRYEEI